LLLATYYISSPEIKVLLLFIFIFFYFSTLPRSSFIYYFLFYIKKSIPSPPFFLKYIFEANYLPALKPANSQFLQNGDPI